MGWGSQRRSGSQLPLVAMIDFGVDREGEEGVGGRQNLSGGRLLISPNPCSKTSKTGRPHHRHCHALAQLHVASLALIALQSTQASLGLTYYVLSILSLSFMASHVVVIDSAARRATVKTTPDKYLTDILNEACEKLGRNADSYVLK